MKLFLFLCLSILSLSLTAKEIPTPKHVKTINNPTMNGIPFLAADGAAYLMAANSQGQLDPKMIITNNLLNICRAIGYLKPYSYTVSEIQDSVANVMEATTDGVISSRLTYEEESTDTGSGKTTSYRSTIFKQISCFTK